MKIQLLSQDAAHLVGFAKNKLRQLRDLRVKTRQALWKKNIFVGEFTIYLETADWGDKIRISGGTDVPMIMAVRNHPNMIYDYRTVQIIGESKKVGLPYKLERQPADFYDNSNGQQIYVVADIPSSGTKPMFFVFSTLGGYLLSVQEFVTNKELSVSPQSEPIPVEGKIPVNGESLDYHGDSFPFDLSSDYQEYPQGKVHPVLHNDGSKSFISIHTSYLSSYLRGSAVLIRKSSTPKGPYEYLGQITTRTMNSWGGVFSGPDDPLYDDVSVDNIANVYEAYAQNSYDSLSLTKTHIHSLVFAGSSNALSKRYADLYSTSIETGETEIYGTIDVCSYTDSVNPRCSILTDRSGHGCCGFSITPNNHETYKSPNADQVWILFNGHGDVNNLTGFFFDPLTEAPIDVETGDRITRQDGDLNEAYSKAFYIGENSFIVVYMSGTPNIPSGVFKVWLDYDADENNGENFVNYKNMIWFFSEDPPTFNPQMSYDRRYILTGDYVLVDPVTLDTTLFLYTRDEGKIESFDSKSFGEASEPIDIFDSTFLT